MAKALQTPFAPLAELTRKNVEMWEQMQAATRDAFKGEGGETPKPADRDGSKERGGPRERGGPKTKKGR